VNEIHGCDANVANDPIDPLRSVSLKSIRNAAPSLVALHQLLLSAFRALLCKLPLRNACLSFDLVQARLKQGGSSEHSLATAERVGDMRRPVASAMVRMRSLSDETYASLPGILFTVLNKTL
jgi:hypothetical protein